MNLNLYNSYHILIISCEITIMSSLLEHFSIKNYTFFSKLQQFFQQMSINTIKTLFISIPGTKYVYQSTKILGEGSGGIIYQGKHTQTHTQVAIKIIKCDNFVQNQIKLSEIVNITKSMRKYLQYANSNPGTLLQIFQVIQLDKTYIIMQLCEYNLNQYLSQKSHKIDEQQIKSILIAIIQSLLFIQNENYHYSDLKPQNVLISQNGQIKLGDLQSLIKLNKTLSNYRTEVFGTLRYMPPQLIQLGQYSTKNYIWTLGIMLHEMIYNNVPFKEDFLDSNYQNRESFYKNLFDLQIDKRYEKEYPFCHILLQKMLHFNDKKRITLQQLFQFLKNPYQECQMTQSLTCKRCRSNSLMTNDSDYCILQLKDVSFQQNQIQIISSDQMLTNSKLHLKQLQNIINIKILPSLSKIKIPTNYMNNFIQLNNLFEQVYLNICSKNALNADKKQLIQYLKEKKYQIQQTKALGYLKKTLKYIKNQRDLTLNDSELKLLEGMLQFQQYLNCSEQTS